VIDFLQGSVVRINPTELIVEVNGVGYLLNIPVSTFEQLGSTAGNVKVFTHLHVREDALTLYGFATEAERDSFKLLLSVNGIGPKIAQGILSGMSVRELREAILQSNLGALTSVQGIGRKTAERLVLELRDKLGKVSPEDRGTMPTSSLSETAASRSTAA
jgi:Holliday junction DNA helicase RuvA